MVLDEAPEAGEIHQGTTMKPATFQQIEFDFSTVPANKLLSLSDAARLLKGRRHQHPHLQVVQRWARQGIAIHGQHLLLPTVTRAGCKWTTEAAIRLWLQRQDELRAERPATFVDRSTARQRRKSFQRSARRLQAMGMVVAGAE